MSMTAGELEKINELIKQMTVGIKAQQNILLDMLDLLQKYANGLLEDITKLRDEQINQTEEK